MSKKPVSRFGAGAIVVMAFFIILITASGSVAAQSEGQLSFETGEIGLSQGGIQTIDITYDSPPDAKPAGIEYDIHYDPEVISVTQQSQGEYIGGTIIANTINNSEGTVEYTDTLLGSNTDSDTGTVATITIEPTVAVDEGESTVLEFSNVGVTRYDSDNNVVTVPTTADSTMVQIEEGNSVQDKVANLTAPTDELNFDDLQEAIQAYQNDEEIQGQKLTFDTIVSLIETYHEE